MENSRPSHRLVTLDTVEPAKVLSAAWRRIVILQAQGGGVRYVWSNTPDDVAAGFTIAADGKEGFSGDGVPNADLYAIAMTAGAKLAIYTESSIALDIARRLESLKPAELLVVDISNVRAKENR
jgi:hypothetical protein